MPSLVIENFKFGLDRRRLVIASQPGVLFELENAHINSGGEIVKRFQFERTAGLTGTFGLELTSSGLVVFGSAATPAGLPAGVSYVRCQHPFVTNGGTYAAANHAMTEIVCSTSFGGNAWCVAKFADGSTWAFYNGTVLRQNVAGLVLTGELTPETQAKNFAAMVNAAMTGKLTAAQLTGADDHKVDVTSATPNAFTPSVTDSIGSKLTTSHITDGLPSYNGVSSKVGFTINAGVTSIDQITVPNGSGGTFNLLTAPGIPYTTSNEITAGLVAAGVNSNSDTTGYTANATGAQVTIYAPLALSPLTGNMTVTYQGTAPPPEFPLSLTITPPTVDGTTDDTVYPHPWLSFDMHAEASGGTAPYTFAWSFEPSKGGGNDYWYVSTEAVDALPPGSVMFLRPVSGDTEGDDYSLIYRWTAFSGPRLSWTATKVRVHCIVTDAAAATAEAICYVGSHGVY